MADRKPVTVDDAADQIARHVESLRGAGVAFLPKTAGLTLPVVEPATPAPVSTPGQQKALAFEGVEIPVVTERSREQRLEELRALCRRVADCQRCPHLAATRTQTVFGVGPIDPDICFVGEAPGGDEDRQGEPFVGAAGQLLNRIIAACGMKREDVFICNILRCRPPGNRTPNAEEASNCREFLEQTIELIRPRYICCLGSCAAQNLLGTTSSIGRLRGRFQQYKGIPVLCTYHPAFLLPHRSPEKKKDVWDDMKMLLMKMGRPIPSPKKGTS
jgi:DNA polymerase